MIAAERARLGKLGHALEIHPDAVEFLIRQGYHRTLGARPMRGTVERHVQEAVARRLLAGESTSGYLTRHPQQDLLVLK